MTNWLHKDRLTQFSSKKSEKATSSQMWSLLTKTQILCLISKENTLISLVKSALSSYSRGRRTELISIREACTRTVLEELEVTKNSNLKLSERTLKNWIIIGAVYLCRVWLEGLAQACLTSSQTYCSVILLQRRL